MISSAATDLIYACIGAVGLDSIANSFSDHKIGFCLISGAILCYLGVTTFLSQPKMQSGKVESRFKRYRIKELISYYASAFSLEIVNPLEMLPFASLTTRASVLN